jgi:putative endonuclease
VRWPPTLRPGRDPLGARGERIAARWLRRRGYRVRRRNLRLGPGEIDLVCVAPGGSGTVVVVEVKTRRVSSSGGRPPPEASVTSRKRRKLLTLARALSARREFRGRPVRIDVVAVEIPPRGRAVVRHHERAVTG